MESIYNKRYRLKKKYDLARENITVMIGVLTREFQSGRIDSETWQTYSQNLNQLDLLFYKSSKEVTDETEHRQ